ncbi:hypothetical protein GCK72_014041 [Caenorhabditis remanei]|uniref:Uncharacterized protein n=1 Tax=Caenorhabditis remanei TaxID=31234 RepID=A0A6A5GSW8_CAERE|nr:hypothetical protein GCK72_014041 [Caenorhabditis remanei]KAF1757585.1 hypothetical protein GCK72_014041 [Caenorhabditis remanei]
MSKARCEISVFVYNSSPSLSIFMSSTSNLSTALAGIFGGAPRSPYPSNEPAYHSLSESESEFFIASTAGIELSSVKESSGVVHVKLISLS